MEKKFKPCETVTPSAAVDALRSVWEKHRGKANCAQSRLYRALFCDLSQHFPNFAPQDFDYLLQRYIAEGVSFYLDTLPKLGKAFETSLITLDEFIVPSGWSLVKGTRLPKFLYHLFSQVIDDDGHPLFTLQNKSGWKLQAPIAVGLIRQICMMWSKVETVAGADELSTPTAVNGKTITAYRGFVERALRLHQFVPDETTRDSVREAARLLRVVFGTPSPTLTELYSFEVKPWGKQGPGAVAGREVGCEKWAFKRWPGLPSSLFDWREGAQVNSEPLDRQPNARLCAVPKDFRGPRVICIEPKENQFAQQGLMDILYRHVQACYLTRNSISFLDTTESRRLCYDNTFATIDLKDASDMLSLRLARLILPGWIFRLVTRYRSRFIEIPELKQVIRPNCLATMGNATCFPLETLLFWALSLGTMIALRDSFKPVQRQHLKLKLRVFGDDVIVPLWAHDAVCHVLEATGSPVNTLKTCSFTPVRESCGEWVFMGQSLRIFRFRSPAITDHRSWLQWRDQQNDLLSETTLFPAFNQQISDEVANYYNLTPHRVRFNKKLQRLEVFAPMFVQRGTQSALTDYAGLYAWHVGNCRTPFLKGALLRVKMRWQEYYAFIGNRASDIVREPAGSLHRFTLLGDPMN